MDSRCAVFQGLPAALPLVALLLHLTLALPMCHPQLCSCYAHWHIGRVFLQGSSSEL